jgi:hypothetical protein
VFEGERRKVGNGKTPQPPSSCKWRIKNKNKWEWGTGMRWEWEWGRGWGWEWARIKKFYHKGHKGFTRDTKIKNREPKTIRKGMGKGMGTEWEWEWEQRRGTGLKPRMNTNGHE